MMGPVAQKQMEARRRGGPSGYPDGTEACASSMADMQKELARRSALGIDPFDKPNNNVSGSSNMRAELAKLGLDQ